MAENDINLATLWVPVVPETSQIKGQLAKAGAEGGATFAASFREATKGLSTVFDAAGASNAGRSIDMLAGRFSKLKDTITGASDGAGKAMQVFNTVGAASVVGLGAAFVETTKKAGDFQASQERLVASAGESAKGMQAVSNGILQLAGQVGYSAQQLSDAMYTVEKAGFRGADGVNLLKAAAQGAKSENADLKEVVSGLTTTLSDFGLSGDKSADVMSKMVAGVGMAKTNFQDFAGALHSVEPAAAAVAQSLDAVGKQHLLADVYGSLAQLTQSGMSAAQSAQNMGRAFTTLSNPSQKMRDELGQLGLNAQDVQQHLGERGLAGSLQLISDRIRSQMNPAGQVMIDTFLKSEQASGAAKKEFDALPPAAHAVAESIKDGTLSFKEFRKSRGGLSVEDANLVQSWNNLNSKVTGFSTALKGGQGDIQTYMQALSLATGNQETARVAMLLSGEATDKTNEAIKTIDGTTREHDGTVKGFNETQSTLNAKMADAKAAFGAAAIEIGTAFIPVMTDVANIAKTVGDAMAAHPAILHGVVTAVEGLATAWLGLKAINIVSGILAPATVALGEVEAAEVAATTAAGGLATALKGLAGPIGVGLAVGPWVGKEAEKGLNSSNWLNDHVRNPVRNFFGADSIPDHKAGGGAIFGAGAVGSDSVPALLAPGEHVLTHHDVHAMGGQANVYTFRKGLHDAGISHFDKGGQVGPGGYSQDQAAAAIISAAKARGLSPEQTLAALSTGILETNLGSNSMTNVQQNQSGTVVQGLFQQDSGYNKYGNRTDPNSAAKGFVDQFIARGGQSMDPYAGAVKVQVGTYGPGYVRSFRDQAASYYDRLSGQVAPGATYGGSGSSSGPTGTPGNPIYTAPTAERAAKADAHVKEIQERLGELKPTAPQSQRDRLNDQLGFAQQDSARAHAQAAQGGGTSGDKGGSDTQNLAQQFGQGMLTGAMSDLGFGNVLGGKSPLDWGIVKLATGLASWGLNMANSWADKRGTQLGLPGFGGSGGGTSGGSGGGGGGGELGDAFNAGLGMLNAPAAFGGGGAGGSASAPSPSDDIPAAPTPPGLPSGGGGIPLPSPAAFNAGKGPAPAQDLGLPGGKGGKTPSWQGMMAGPGFPGAPTPGSPDWFQQYQQGLTHPGTPQNFLPPLLGVIPGVGGFPSNGSAPPMPSYHGGPQVIRVPHLSTGGPSGSDTVPAWLSPGEYVMKSAAVQKYGAKFMSHLNAGKFDTGGQVAMHGPVSVGDAVGGAISLATAFFADGKAATPSFTSLHNGEKVYEGTSPGLRAGHALTPSRVSGVPTAAGKNQGETVSHHVTNDNRIIVHGNTLADPHQLAAPMQEKMNAKTYSRGGMQSDGRSASMPAYTGGGGG